MIYLLDRNQIISHSVNKSDIHHALSEIAKFISLSIYDKRDDFNFDIVSFPFLNVPLIVYVLVDSSVSMIMYWRI